MVLLKSHTKIVTPTYSVLSCYLEAQSGYLQNLVARYAWRGALLYKELPCLGCSKEVNIAA